MGRVLIVTGIFLIVAGFALVLATIESPKPVSKIEEIGSGFTDISALSPDEINKTISVINQVVEDVNNAGISNRNWARFSSIVSLILASLISILSGWQKMVADRDHQNTTLRLTVIIGLLGSITAISAATGEYFTVQSDTKFLCVEEIEDKTRETLIDVREETDPIAARQYLGELSRKAKQCE